MKCSFMPLNMTHVGNDQARVCHHTEFIVLNYPTKTSPLNALSVSAQNLEVF